VAVVDARASLLPLLISVCTGDALDDLHWVADNQLTWYLCTNWFSFTASAGTTYRLAVDSQDDTGQFVFALVDLPALEFTATGLDAQGRFQSLVRGMTTNLFVIQVSSDLLRWTPVATNALVDGQFLFQDADPLRVKRRFYQAVESP
jgi:hypothetical protein